MNKKTNRAFSPAKLRRALCLSVRKIHTKTQRHGLVQWPVVHGAVYIILGNLIF